ncbi:MAG: exo-alpha-sialidase [Firmicutes bacterium]|nr:exo-alpha-sialidase [Bacillota bacterium]
MCSYTKCDLPSREELIAQGYPYGKSTEGIPQGNTEVEWKRTKPDVVVYRPHMEMWDGDNEHFLVFESPRYDGLMAIWTQSSCEGRGDNHIMFSRSSADQQYWEPPKVLMGKSPKGVGTQASWGFPVVSKSGRIYVFAVGEIQNTDVVGYDVAMRQHAGGMVCIYSDDNGETWVKEDVLLPVRRTRFAADDPNIPVAWIVFQVPIRGADGKYLVGYTDWGYTPKMEKSSNAWIHSDSHCYFLRFENIDDDPSPKDVVITWFPETQDGLTAPDPIEDKLEVGQEPSVVLLPNGWLFTVYRTVLGCPYYSVSEDNGVSWRTPEPLLYHDGGERMAHPMSPCELYRIKDDRYIFIFHNNDGSRLWFKQSDPHWKCNYANYFRNPTYISVASFTPSCHQPLSFGAPVEFLNTGDISVGPKKTAETGTYTSLTQKDGRIMLWYPDRKYYLLGKEVTEEIINKSCDGENSEHEKVISHERRNT